MPIDYGNNNVSTSGNIVASSGNFTTALTVNNAPVATGTSVSITNATDNRVLTSSNTSGGINAESNLTFDGTTLAATGVIDIDNLRLDGNTISSTNSNGSIIIQPSGTGALQRSSDGNSRGINSIDWQTVRSSGSMVASGSHSTIGGGRDNTSSGYISTVGGGKSNVASGGASVVCGGGLAGTFTVTIASPAVFTMNNHGLVANDTVVFSTTGSLPTGLTSGTTYYIIATGLGPNSFRASTSLGGSAVNTSGSQSGVHSLVNLNRTNTASGNSSVVGGGFGNTSSGSSSSIGGGRNNTSSGRNSTVGGGSNNSTSNTYSTVGGGRFNTSSGLNSTVGGGYFNTSNGYNSTVGGGRFNTSSGTYSTVGGGRYNTSSGYYSTIGGGQRNTSSGYGSTVCGGILNTSSGYASTITGGLWAEASLHGEEARSSGKFNVQGDAQVRKFLLRNKTTQNSTIVNLYLSGSSGELIIPLNCTWLYTIQIVGRNQDNIESAGYIIQGVLERSTLGSILLSEDKITLYQDNPNWDVDVSIVENDTILRISCAAENGQADVYWLAYVKIVQIIVPEQTPQY